MATTTTSRARDPHYFELSTGFFGSVQLIKGNYAPLASVLGYTTTPPADTATVEDKTLPEAVNDGFLVPVRVMGKKDKKTVSAIVFVPRTKIEEAFTQLKGKKYGTWTISKVKPIVRRKISAY